ncbi:MAG TPA: DUF2333 domain-containing protein [Porticoccaceae bacterium]|jgi:hypothetical protein|nr:DUF2333 domain-containing protein [Porticoccaceae bacterium]
MAFFPNIKSAWKRLFSDTGATLSEEYVGENAPKVVRFGLYSVVIIFVFITVLGIYWSSEPTEFNVIENGNAHSKQLVGATTTSTLIKVVEVLLNKPGGYLSNDILPPGVWMDNLPSWEYGVLIQVRDLSKAMRESFSRSQSQSTEDYDLSLAEPRFNVDHQSWAVPWPEREYSDGRDYLDNYLTRLKDQETYDAQFYARADNLRYWLGTVEKRLGSLSQRLSASVGQRRINTDLAGSDGALQSTYTPKELIVKTSWWQIDNVFYEARGTAWALVHFLNAIEVDYGNVLAKKNALASVQQIIRELEMTQQPIRTPMIVNGEGFGLLANHSLVMASYISRANAAIIDLRELLSKG